ncbi:MAG: hypothetical protein D6732_24975 [Methanobacteriota archaeon]|nr:MAG: hypothetical protein D6732_24975 [Euryarchaeota archaeon]
MGEKGFFSILNRSLIIIFNLSFIFAFTLIALDQLLYSQPFGLLKIFIVENLEIIGMLILSWIPISLGKVD